MVDEQGRDCFVEHDERDVLRTELLEVLACHGDIGCMSKQERNHHLYRWYLNSASILTYFEPNITHFSHT